MSLWIEGVEMWVCNLYERCREREKTEKDIELGEKNTAGVWGRRCRSYPIINGIFQRLINIVKQEIIIYGILYH